MRPLIYLAKDIIFHKGNAQKQKIHIAVADSREDPLDEGDVSRPLRPNPRARGQLGEEGRVRSDGQEQGGGGPSDKVDGLFSQENWKTIHQSLITELTCFTQE